MNSSDQYVLLGALSFFFICMALALVWLKGQARETNSYMPSIDRQQTQPLQNAQRRQSAMPESVLHYSSDEMVNRNTVECMLEPEYKNLVNASIVEQGYKLAIVGNLKGDHMEIYTHDDGKFFVVAKGPDAIGNSEACIVAEGEGWLPMNQ